MKDKLRILFIGSKRNVGLSVYFTHVAIAIKKAGNHVILISTHDEEEPHLFEKIEKAKIKHYQLNELDHIKIKTFLTETRKLGKIIDYENIDIIHANGIRHLIYVFVSSKLFARKKNTKIIVTIHSILHGTPYMKAALLIESILINLCANLALPVSKSTLIKLKKYGTLPNKTITVYNAADPTLTKPNKKHPHNSILKALPPKPSITIGYCAELIPRKGHKYLIQAFSEILKENPNSKLILTNNGPLENELKKLCQELKIEKNVIFTGKISYKNLYQLLEKIDIYAFPSLSELFPLAILEAMSTGKPIVATNIDGILEAIKHEENGILIPPKNPHKLAEAIKELIKNPRKAKKMGERNKELIRKKFSMEKIANDITRCYQLVMKRRRNN